MRIFKVFPGAAAQVYRGDEATRSKIPAMQLATQTSKDIFSHRKYWAARFGAAPYLPMSRAEM